MARVLIADDDLDICRLLRANLELEGYEVSMAHDGEAATRAAIAEPPDVMVLDVMMPGMDGLQVLAALKAEPRTADIPIIVLSARTADDQVWAGWEAGAACYLTKPLAMSELMHFVKMLQAKSDDLPEGAEQMGEMSSVLKHLESYGGKEI